MAADTWLLGARLGGVGCGGGRGLVALARRLVASGAAFGRRVAQFRPMLPNKALHPTAYSPAVRASLWRFRQRVSLVVRPVRAAFLIARYINTQELRYS